MLKIEGNLEINADGGVAFLYGHESHIEVDLEQPSSRFIGWNLVSRLRTAKMFARYLHETGLTLIISYKGRECVVVGRAAKCGLSSRILGLRHIEMRLHWSTLKLIFG